MNLENLLIDEQLTMIDAMKILDTNASKILFVTSDGKLMATLTDGDVRRWILKNGDLTAEVKNLANYNPVFLRIEDEKMAVEIMKKNKIEALPIVDETLKIVSVSFMNAAESIREKKIKIPVVIMAGGLGTRLYPYTKVLPKALVPIGDLPIVEHIMNRFNKYGAENFHLIVNHKKNMIKAYFNESDLKYNISFEDEKTPLGTGGGLFLLKNKIKTSFILSNCDILIEEDMNKIWDCHTSNGNLVTMICSLKNIKVPYGVIELDANGCIESMREKPEMSFLTNTGIYIVNNEIFKYINDNEDIGFPDILLRAQMSGEKIGVYPISEESWLDMGQIEEMEKMRDRLAHGK